MLMKKYMLKFSKCLAALALMITALNVNTTCLFAAHQPKLPSGANGLRKLLLAGEVKERVFNITGIPKLLNYNGNVIYFECRDTLDNYTVLNVSLEKNIEESAFYHKGFAANKNFGNILKIYLQPKGSNDVVILEYFNSPLIEAFQLSDSITGEYDENADLKLKYWYGRILQPVERTPDISPQAVDNNIGTYRYEYNHLGSIYTHCLEISRRITTGNVTSGGSYFITNLYINNNYVLTELGNEASDLTSFYEIDDVAVEMAVDAGDGVDAVAIDGDVYTSSSIDVTVSFNEFSIGSVGSVGVTYTSGERNFDLNNDL